MPWDDDLTMETKIPVQLLPDGDYLVEVQATKEGTTITIDIKKVEETRVEAKKVVADGT
jgi:hypothetical protein